MRRYTSGEWSYDAESGQIYAPGKVIAQVYGPESGEEISANGCLMARASEMYEKLIDCAEFLEGVSMEDCEGCSEFAYELLASVEAVISRAEYRGDPLKACPFCGSAKIEIESMTEGVTGETWYGAVCQSCGGSAGKFIDEEYARRAWEERAQV